MNKPEPFEVRYSIPKMLGWTALAAVAVAFCIWVMFNTSDAPAIAAGIGAVLFNFSFMIFLFKLFDRRVQLRIADNTFLLRPHSSQAISLRSVKNFRLLEQRVVFLFYKPSKYPIERPLRRFIYKINGAGARAYFGDAWMWLSQYDCTARDIMDGVNAHIELTEFEKEMLARREAAEQVVQSEVAPE